MPLHHDERLQALRGIAALLVIVGHGLIILPQTPVMFALGGIFEADAAVVFFYVLSGLVLGQSLSRHSQFLPFVVRRLARLIPALWASLGAAVVVSLIVAGSPLDEATDWFNVYRSVDTSPHQIVLNALGLSWRINSVMWSVQIEFFVIPLLPLGVLAMRRLTPWQAAAVLAALCAAAVQLVGRVEARPLAYLFCFYIGIFLPSVAARPTLRPIFEPRVVVAGLVVATMFHEARIALPLRTMVDALVSAQLLGYIIRSAGVAQFLRHRWLVVVGDISYSLYAFGQIVLILIANTMFALLPANAAAGHPNLFSFSLIALNLALVVPIAAASYRWIELPGMALGKSLLNRPITAAAT